jgi:hypothetical protein
MLLTGIAKQIEAQARARARRYEAEYLANIFGLDCEPRSESGVSFYDAASADSLATGSTANPTQGAAEAARSAREARARKAMPLFEDIVSAVAEATHITPAQMSGRSQRQRISYARQLAMYLMRQITHSSYQLIGDFFGREHATVMYACESMRARLPFEPEGRRALDKIATIFSERRRQLQDNRRNE